MQPHLLFLCTGNAARSVMAGVMLEDRLPDVRVTTAGTHVVEGMPMSWRTRDSITELGIKGINHRSHQLTDEDVAVADAIVGMAGEHVAYIRRVHPETAGKAVTLKRLARDLPPGGDPFVERLAAMEVGLATLEPWEDVGDPAGGELPVFQECAREILELVDTLARALSPERAARPLPGGR